MMALTGKKKALCFNKKECFFESLLARVSEQWASSP